MNIEDKYLKESELYNEYILLEPDGEAERKSIKLYYSNSCYTCRYGSLLRNDDIMCENATVLREMIKYNKIANENDEYIVLTKPEYVCKHFSKKGAYN